MQGQQQAGVRQRGPRFGDNPQPRHWAAGLDSFAGMAYIAHGLDCLAGTTGMADGLSVLLKGCDLTIEQVQAASRQDVRDWYYRCYAEYSGRQLVGAWDVVAHDCGIYSFNSGWCPPPRH